MIVDNRPGADTLLGTRFVKDAPADGYTILLQEASGVTVLPWLKQDPGYDLVKDFTAVGPIIRSAFVMLVPADEPNKTLGEFIARAKANPNKLSYAHGGVGTRRTSGPPCFCSTPV